MNKEIIVGIDLGTTNSSIAVVQNGTPCLIPVDDDYLLPSVVGFSSDDELLVGKTARNQALVYPERTVCSIKRQMGQASIIQLGAEQYTPAEISAIILRRLKRAAEEHLGCPINRAVITVPAYFTDAQRTATKQAGEMAGLTVARIVNEPTAAALCYAEHDASSQIAMVFDLGGGTFDVSIVKINDDITEVLASHGDTALGGDDFDEELASRLADKSVSEHGIDPLHDLRSATRLRRAVEEAKIRLSVESYSEIAVEHIFEKEGIPIHLDQEISRREYEEIIFSLVDRTKDSVQRALNDAGLLAAELDAVILVGGSTKIPMVSDMLEKMLGRPPLRSVDPDTAVALGASLMAARIAGDGQSRILIDVTPYSFGTSCLKVSDGLPHHDYYEKIVNRNSPLPTRQTKVFYTVICGQENIDVKIYQGEDECASNNTLIGRFMVEGLDPEAPEHSEILFDLTLNLDGLLEVDVTEHHTGLAKGIVIDDAFGASSEAQIADSQKRVRNAFDDKESDPLTPPSPKKTPSPPSSDLSQQERSTWSTAEALIEKADRLLPELDDLDKKEIQDVVTSLTTSMRQADFAALNRQNNDLSDMLFYIE